MTISQEPKLETNTLLRNKIKDMLSQFSSPSKQNKLFNSLLILSAALCIFLFVRLLFNDLMKGSQAGLIGATAILSLWIIGISFVRFRRVAKERSRLQVLVWLMQITITLAVVIFAHPLLSQWATRFVSVSTADRLLTPVWFFLVPFIGICFFVWQTDAWNGYWKALLVGVSGGTILHYLWTPIVYLYTYNHYVPETHFYEETYSAHSQLALGLGIGVLFVSGIAALRMAKPTSRQQSITLAAITGLTISLFLFATPGTILSGIASQSPLYSVAISRAGYDEAGWIDALVKSLIYTFPWLYGVLLTCITLGALPIVIGLIWPIRTYVMSSEKRLSAFIPTTLVFLFLTIMSSLAFFVVLTRKIINTFEAAGTTSWWDPRWIVPTVLALPSLAIVLLLSSVLIQLPTMTRSFTNANIVRAIGAVIFLGALGINFVYVDVPAIVLLLIGLGVELFFQAGRLTPVTTSSEDPLDGLEASEPPTSIVSMSASFTLLLFLPVLIIPVVMALIPIAMIPELRNVTDPPPGLPWLLNLIQTFLTTTLTISWIFNAGMFTFLYCLEYGLRTTGSRAWWLSSEPWLQRIAHSLRIKTSGGWKEYFFTTLIILLTIYSTVFGSAFVSTILMVLLLLWILVNVSQSSFQHHSMFIYSVAATVIVLETIYLAYQRDLPSAGFDSTIVLWPAFAVLYAGLVSKDSRLSKSIGRIVFLVAIGILASLMINFAKPVTLIENGVAKFSGGRWEVLDFRDGNLVSDRNYSLTKDSQDRLWFISYFGPDAVEHDGEWSRLRFYSNATDFVSDVEGRTTRLESPGLFTANGENYWFTNESAIYMLVPTTNGYVSHIPRQALPGAQAQSPTEALNDCNSNYICPNFDGKKITVVSADHAGNIWVGTDGAGLVRLLADRSPDNADWKYFTTENSKIASDNILDILNDVEGNIWFLGPTTVSILSPAEQWSTYSLDGIGLAGNLQAIYEDSQRRIWIGSSSGISRLEKDKWVSSSELRDSVREVYQDSSGQIWALTSSGAYVYRDGKWMLFRDIPQDPLARNPFRVSWFYRMQSSETGITSVTEDLDGVLWFGGPHGLMRYDHRTNQADILYPSNSGLPSEHVRSMLVDSNNELWISTYTVNRAYRSELPVIGFVLLFMLMVLGNIYTQYQKSAPFRASQVSKRLVNQPQAILREIYTIFQEKESSQILESIAQQLRSHQQYYQLVQAYSDINSENGIRRNEKANHILDALNNNLSLPESKDLIPLYAYFSRALSVLTVNDISKNPLQVLRAEDGKKISLTDEKTPPYELSSSVDVRVSTALEMFGKSSMLIRKYLQIDNAQDKLGIIADSLAAVERARMETGAVTGPEQYFILGICDLWLEVIRAELNVLSGRADLRVEFRTRQVKQSDEVTLVLSIRNAGSAIANQVQLSLLPNAGILLDSKVTRLIEFIGAGSSETAEFVIRTPAVGDVRIAGEITWSDRIEVSNRVEFADIVRFYEVTQRFERIPNPYIVGHPVKSASLFQGRDDIFDFISHNISGTTQSRTLVLYGQRRTGKTSILYQLLNGRLGGDYIPILVDVQEIAPGIQSMADLFLELAIHIERALRKIGFAIERVDEATFVTSPTRSFSRFLSNLEGQLASRKIVLMFDEFELLEERILQGKLEPESLGYLRSLMQHKENLIFIFTGTHKLEQMSSDYWSIFFNIALHQQITFMKDEDATRLIRGPVQGKLSIDDLVVDKIISLAHGHPYFIQLLCWALVNCCNKREKNYATPGDLNDVLIDIVSTGDAYFAYIWTQAKSDEKIMMSALAERLAPGKTSVSIQEILEAIENVGVQTIDKAAATRLLDALSNQEILTSSGRGGLLYSYRVGLIGEWVKSSKPLRNLVEREL